MNTENDSPQTPESENPYTKVADSGVKYPETARNTAEVELEQALATEKDGRREDRFLFVVALVVIFDVWAMQGVETWTLPLVVGITQLFALLIFARRMGVEEIHFWLNQLLPRINLGLKKPEPQSPAENKPEAPKSDNKQ